MTRSGAVLAAGAPGRASAGVAYEAGRDRPWVACVGLPQRRLFSDARVQLERDRRRERRPARGSVLGWEALPGRPTTGTPTRSTLAVPASVTRTVSSWSGTRFYVLRPFDNRVTVISLRPHLAGGVVLGDLTDTGFDMTATATVATGGL